MRLVLLLFVAVAALGAEAAAPAAAAPCSVAEAKIAINVQVPGLAHGTLPVAPDQAGKVICFDFTRDGRTDMAVTVFSGGTAGDIAAFQPVATATTQRSDACRPRLSAASSRKL